MSYKEDRKRFTAITNNTVKCKCGCSVTFTKQNRRICNWCGYWVYKDKKTEFKYKMMEKLKKKGTYENFL